MPVGKNELEYNMNHPKTGYAIIFNHEEFAMEDTPPRLGSKMDASRLEKILVALGFCVQVCHDLDSDKIKTAISECE